MKTPYLIFVLFVLTSTMPGFSKAQINDGQLLSKYSYPIFAVMGSQQYTGTAFFYRSGDTSFLVSNYHAIKGMSPLKQAITFRADTLYLKYPVRRSLDFKIMAINVAEEITGKTEIFSMIDRIDLLKIPVELPADADMARPRRCRATGSREGAAAVADGRVGRRSLSAVDRRRLREEAEQDVIDQQVVLLLEARV